MLKKIPGTSFTPQTFSDQVYAFGAKGDLYSILYRATKTQSSSTLNTTRTMATGAEIDFVRGNDIKSIVYGRDSTSPVQHYAMTILSDGTLWRVGKHPGLSNLTSWTQIGTDTDWKQLEQSYQSGTNCVFFAVKDDGTFWMWGDNTTNLTPGSQTTPTQVGSDTDWEEIFPGNDAVGLIKTDGSAYAMGNNRSGCLGVGSATTPITSLTQIGSATNWKQFHFNYVPENASVSQSVGVRTDGTLWIAGNGNNVGIGSSNNFQQVGTDTDWDQVGINLALKDSGTLYSWYNGEQTTFDGGPRIINSSEMDGELPTQVASGISFKTLRGMILIDSDDELWSAGAIAFTPEGSTIQGLSKYEFDNKFKDVYMARGFLAKDTGNRTYLFSLDGALETAAEVESLHDILVSETSTTPTDGTDYYDFHKMLYAGSATDSQITNIAERNGAVWRASQVNDIPYLSAPGSLIEIDGVWYCVGNNTRDTVGTNDVRPYINLIQKPAMNYLTISPFFQGYKKICIVNTLGLGIDKDNFVVAWGNSTRTGTIADTSNTADLTIYPVKIAIVGEGLDVSLYQTFEPSPNVVGAAINSNGDYYAYDNQGTTLSADDKWFLIDDSRTYKKCVAGNDALYGLTNSGIFSMGDNSDYRTGLGTNSGTTSSMTEAISGNFVELEPTPVGFLAIRSDGALFVAGTSNYQSPTQIGTDTDWKQLSHSVPAGDETCFALKDNGEVYIIDFSGGTPSVDQITGSELSNIRLLRIPFAVKGV